MLGATPEEGGGVELRCPLSEQDMNTLCECLKIIFNQTLHWIPSSDVSGNTMSWTPPPSPPSVQYSIVVVIVECTVELRYTEQVDFVRITTN